jgi:DNA-binding XRE family transcriptional regulator
MTYKEYKETALAADPELRREYDALAPEYTIVHQLIQARLDANLTQKELAKRVGIRQSNISRLESGRYNPSLEFLKKLAHGLGKEVYIEFREPMTQVK